MLESEMMDSKIILLDSNELVAVSSLGKPFGLHGGVRTFLITDFPEIFVKDSSFYICLSDIAINKSINDIFKPTISNLHKTKHSNNIGNPIHNIAKNPNTKLSNISCIVLTLCRYDVKKQALFFNEVTSKEQAELLRNSTLYSTIESTRQFCKLSEFEFFYFDVIGMQVVEDGEILGVVSDIQDIANTHYFILNKNFLIPYIDRYVLSIDKNKGQIITRDAKFLRT